MFKLYESTIIPIITYASEIWISDFNFNLKSIDKTPFEKIQNFICKDILGVHSKSSNLAIKMELGILPLYIKIYKLMFRYYSRLSKLRDSTTFYSGNILLKNAFIEDCNLANSGEKSWLKSLKDFQSHCKIESF